MNSKLTPEERSSITLTNILKSDCGVIAIQAVSGLPRKAAELLAKRHGYTPTGGTPRGGIDAALAERGFVLTPVEYEPKETAASFACRHEYGTYLIYVDEHVMALVEGDLHNSRGAWHDRVEEIKEVTHG